GQHRQGEHRRAGGDGGHLPPPAVDRGSRTVRRPWVPHFVVADEVTHTAVPAPPLVPDLAEVNVPVGGRVLVVSDIHLARETTTASTFAATELAQTVESWTGPGVVILAGDCFELLEGSVHDPRPAL